MSSTFELGGVLVPDSSLIRTALDFIRKHSSDMTYNHVIRSWIHAVLIYQRNVHSHSMDAEVVAIATLLHDLAWDCTGHPEFVSKDKRFEVDSANAARDFLADYAPDWTERRVQLVWDAIALHTTPSIANHKEPEVRAACAGISCDILGPGLVGGALTSEEVGDVAKNVPRLGLKEGLKGLMCNLCREKPMTTYDNFAGDVGHAFLDGYQRKTFVDLMELGMVE